MTTARALLDDAAVTVMTHDGDDITAVSSPKRTIPAKVRRALEDRYPTCGVQGCANNQFLEIDHIVPLEHYGRTEIDNPREVGCHPVTTRGVWFLAGEDRATVAQMQP